ncbi:hypothetical protein KSC_052420 [Ktedonobacter sp. SOSP1-52]|uniref:NYN domain-containing protein n=1 Tax=Ktedonobacter sp. SOSP1-52 TaxID=2778366 RepID=UPI001915A921|nr:NYN domain-containing protein [Ktedonobacter sp. SOSP1-52]GHO66350.1 hypothetical protein KSC_052420 [Ktedonobacter sp. SOSP1-52]
MPEDIALFIDFENIRYSMLNIQRREPDPQELIAVARRYGTVMVARAYADWSRQPEPFKGSLTAAMIDRVDCPAKQRDRIRMGTIHYASNTPTGPLGAQSYVAEQNTGSFPRPWPSGMSASSGSLPAIQPQQGLNQGWSDETDDALSPARDEMEEENFDEERIPDDDYSTDYQNREAFRSSSYQQRPYDQTPQPTGTSLAPSNTGPLGYSTIHTGNTGHMPAVNSGNSTIVQSTVVQSTVDLNMLMDIIETVFDRPTISTFVLMTGDKDFTRISARLKLRLNKNVIVVGIPGTVSRDLISSANQFVPLVPGGLTSNGVSGNTGSLPIPSAPYSSGNTGSMPAVNYPGNAQYPQAPYGAPTMDVLDPLFIQFLDYIDRNWSWRTIIGVSNFIGDPVNPKNRFRGRLTRESARELLNTCIQQNILLVQTDPTGAEDLRLNRSHPGVDEVLKQFVR